MAITFHSKHKGFSLLVAVIFVSVVLSLALTLGSLAYKQQVLASGALDSQYAFFAADGALECALYMDQQEFPEYDPLREKQNPFLFDTYALNPRPNKVLCPAGAVAATVSTLCFDGSNAECAVGYRKTKFQLPIAYDDPTVRQAGHETLCADVTVYKPQTPDATHTTQVFSQGYNVPCAKVSTGFRVVARGLYAVY